MESADIRSRFLRYFEELRQPVLDADWGFVAGMLRAVLTGADDGRLLPARDVAGIRVSEILDALRQQHADLQIFPVQPLPAVQALQAGFDSGWRAACGEQTLRDLLA